jgi:hypothetical protein
MNKNILPLILLKLTSLITLIGCNSGKVASSNNTNNNNNQPFSVECQQSLSNFYYQINQNLYLHNIPNHGWGPEPNHITQLQSNNSCKSNLSWAQQRILAAAYYWVQKQVNYCHHHLPTWLPPSTYRINDKGNTVGCPSQPNISRNNSSTENLNIRWTYKLDQQGYWEHTGQWLGIDCSNFTALVYNWGLGILFSNNVNLQGGQRLNKQQLHLTPNQPGFHDNILDMKGNAPAGKLVCMDGTTATFPTNHNGCNKHGGFMSTFDATGKWNSKAMTDEILQKIQPGDILYIATGAAYKDTSIQHATIWTGQQIGPDAINPSLIAPNQFCGYAEWAPKTGNWVVVDSTYQGPDYRNFSYCFYRSNVWGVRRVL